MLIYDYDDRNRSHPLFPHPSRTPTSAAAAASPEPILSNGLVGTLEFSRALQSNFPGI